VNPEQNPQQGGAPPSAANSNAQPPVVPGGNAVSPANQQQVDASVPNDIAPMGFPGAQPPEAAQIVTGSGTNSQKPQAKNGVTTMEVQAKNPNSTQNTLLINEVRDGMAIMGDGSMRAVVACRSINFDLMSSREREGVEYGYQSFLNSLYFPVQIFVRSQRVDIGPYLDKLSKLRRDQDNMLLGVLMDDYINFIAAISEETNIMDKQFYIVIPYYPTGDLTSAVTSTKNLMANITASQKQSVVHIDENTYQKAKDEMQNRAGTVMGGLAQMAVQSTRLDTKQISELFYNVYNPDTSLREPLGNFDPTPTVVIRKGQGEAPQPHLEKEIL